MKLDPSNPLPLEICITSVTLSRFELFLEAVTMTGSIRLLIVRRGSSSSEAPVSCHGHQTRNKYILLCSLGYLVFVSTKLSHLYNNLFQQTNIPVSVFFTT